MKTPDGKTQTPYILLWNSRSALMPSSKTPTPTRWASAPAESWMRRTSGSTIGALGTYRHQRTRQVNVAGTAMPQRHRAGQQGSDLLARADARKVTAPNATSGRWVRASAGGIPRQATRLAKGNLWLYEDRITPSAKSCWLALSTPSPLRYQCLRCGLVDQHGR